MDINSNQVQEWIKRLTNVKAADRFRAVSEMSRHAVRVRGRVRTRGAVNRSASSEMPKALEEALDNLVESTDEDLRREVAYALGGLGGDASVSPLCYLALKDSQARVRTEAVSALGKIGGPEAINALMQIAVKDRDEAVRTESVDALGGLWATTTSLHEGQRVRDCLQQVAQSDISPYVRERAVNMMSA